MGIFVVAYGFFRVDVAEGEILIRFPAGTDISHVSGTAKSLERITGIPTLGVLEVRPAQAASPTIPTVVEERLDTAKTAYRKLELDSALSILKGAEQGCLEAASYGACRSFMFEANMVRGMALMATAGSKETEEAAQAFRSAHIAEPTRVLNPKQYPPNVLRAFANAWTSSETMPSVACTAKTQPPAARVIVDGVPHQEPNLSLAPGRHVIETHHLGYESQHRIVEIDSTGSCPAELSFQLAPESDVVAWKRLIQAISNPDWLGADDEVMALLDRFGIDRVLLLSAQKGKMALQATLFSRSQKGMRSLPAFGRLGDPVSDGFAVALKAALGIVQEAPKREPAPSRIGPSDIDDFFDDDDSDIEDEDGLDEDEDPSIRFGRVESEKEDANSSLSTVFKSPWLWVSVGIVAAIVAGVVVSTQVED